MTPLPFQNRVRRLLVAGLCWLPSALVAANEPAPPLTAAVLSFQTNGEILAGKGPETAALLNVQLAKLAPEVIFVERQEIDKVLAEQELGLSGTVTPDTAARVGALTGAKVLVTGRLFETSGKFFLTAKVIGTETSRVFGESATFSDLSALDKGVDELATKLTADLQRHSSVLVAVVEAPEARLERLKKLVAGKALPSVSVVIHEQHIGQMVIDPAAQTEMKKVLQLLGCEVLEPGASNRQADVHVTGEAFSEAAGRRGNLFSDRARVEIKVVRSADGKLLLADRQSGVAVDLAENIAGKIALQDASAHLLDRLVPKLAEVP